MIIDPEPWQFGARLIALLICGTVLVAGWGYLPLWAIVGIAISTALYGFQNLFAWLFKYVVILEEDNDKRLMLVPSHPFDRKMLSVKLSNLTDKQILSGNVAVLFGYVGYELGTLNNQDEETERKLKEEFRRLKVDSRSALLINNF